MLRITITRAPAVRAPDAPTLPGDCAGLSVTIADEHAPALRSALEELRNTIGARLEDAHLYAKEDALTRASIAVNTLAAGINQVVPQEDPNYV